MDDLDEEENLEEEPQATQERQEDVQGAPQGIRCGGEDGENGGTMSQRQRLNVNTPDGSLVRRGRGKVDLVDSVFVAHTELNTI